MTLMTFKMLRMAELLVFRPKKQMCYQRTDQPTNQRTDIVTYDMKFLNVSFGDSPCFPAHIKLKLAIRGFASYGNCSQYMPVHSNS